MDNLISISEAAKILGVSEKTLRIWDKQGKLKAIKTVGGHRRYDAETIRDMIKTNRIEKTIYDDFMESDIKADHDHKNKIFQFWSGKGLVDQEPNKDNKSLAILLNNYIEYSRSCISSDSDDSLNIKLICKTWNKLFTKNIISFQTMNGPTGLVYAMREEEKNIHVYSEPIIATTRLSETRAFIKEDINHFVTIDPVTLEPTNNPYTDYCSLLDDETLLEFNSTNLANEIDQEILSDLTNNAQVLENKPEIFTKINNKKIHFIITNKFGLLVLNKLHDMPKYEPTKSIEKLDTPNGITILYNENHPNEILYCSEITTFHVFFFCPYIVTMSPLTVNGRRFLLRYAKKMTYSFKDYFLKLKI